MLPKRKSAFVALLALIIPTILFSQSRIVINSGDIYDVDYKNKVFKLIPNGKKSVPVFYDHNLNVINFSEADYKKSYDWHVEEGYTGYTDDEGNTYGILIGDDTYNFHPDRTTWFKLAPPEKPGAKRKEVENVKVKFPLSEEDKLVEAKQQGSSYLLKGDFKGLAKASYPIDNKFSERIIYRMTGVEDKLQCQIFDYDIVNREIRNSLDLWVEMPGQKCIRSYLLGHYENDLLAGYYLMVAYSAKEYPSYVNDYTIVFSSYDLEGQLLARKAYNAAVLHSAKYEVDFTDQREFDMPVRMSVYDQDGIFAMFDLMDGRIAVMDEKMEIKPAFTWADKPNLEEVPALWVTIINEWNDVTRNSPIPEVQNCKLGPNHCKEDLFYFKVFNLWGEKYVYFDNVRAKKNYIVKVKQD